MDLEWNQQPSVVLQCIPDPAARSQCVLGQVLAAGKKTLLVFLFFLLDCLYFFFIIGRSDGSRLDLGSVKNGRYCLLLNLPLRYFRFVCWSGTIPCNEVSSALPSRRISI